MNTYFNYFVSKRPLEKQAGFAGSAVRSMANLLKRTTSPNNQNVYNRLLSLFSNPRKTIPQRMEKMRQLELGLPEGKVSPTSLNYASGGVTAQQAADQAKFFQDLNKISN